MYSLDYYYKHKLPLNMRGAGRFRKGDIVCWMGKVGKIVEVVSYGMYPDYHTKLRVRGYYRSYESYVVEDKRGKRYWPRVGNLKLMKRVKNV